MEKLRALALDATNEKEKAKVSNKHIPDDLALSILSRLPIKSLKRFACCQKSWNHLFENPNFMSMYRNNFIFNCHDDSPLLLQHPPPPLMQGDKSDSTLYLLSGENFENKVKLDWPPPFQENHGYIKMLGSGTINGTLFLMGETQIVLWNPATEEFKVIPPSPSESVPPNWYPCPVVQGFGYDHVRDDYKVIRCVTYFGPEWNVRYDDMVGDVSWENVSSTVPFWEIYNEYNRTPGPRMCEIYSLRSDNWRILRVNMPWCIDQNRLEQVYFNGMCHWLAKECLVSFDLSNEVFFTTPMPSDMDEIMSYIDSTHDCFVYRDFVVTVRDLVVLNGSMGLISYFGFTTTFHISILGELGVKESWTKLFTVGPLPCVEHPIGVGHKGDIFFRKEDNELVCFNLSTQTIQDLGFKGYAYRCQTGFYRESFLPIGGINN